VLISFENTGIERIAVYMLAGRTEFTKYSQKPKLKDFERKVIKMKFRYMENAVSVKTSKNSIILESLKNFVSRKLNLKRIYLSIGPR